ncbi:MAG: GreA/GreB family elongation factor [Rariglobus sp.]|jgi:transcription elongation factor GreB|nr:GreA/GreB family elongation factor [Rariglobus sp.]
MSKAFIREDDIGEERVVRRPVSSLPPGEQNYLTPAGAHRLREAVAELKHERIALASPPVSADARRELQEIDHRVRYLEESLRTAEIVQVPPPPWTIVRFGAIVVVRDSEGEEARYRIVGVDEADLFPDSVSWRSPIGRALLLARVGQRVTFESPRGRVRLEILSISYA